MRIRDIYIDGFGQFAGKGIWAAGTTGNRLFWS